MFGDVLSFFLNLWNAWASLFDALPHGDPYIAFVVLFTIFCLIGWTVPKIQARIQRSRGEDLPFQQLERVARCLNIR